MSRKKIIENLLPVLFEADGIIAIDKPYGVDVGRRENRRSTGIAELLAEFRPGITESELLPINRLGLYESGVLLLTADPDILERTRAAFARGRINQTFFAVVLGKMARGRLDLHRRKPPATRKTAPVRGRKGKPERRASTQVESTGSEATLTRIGEGTRRQLVRCETRLDTTHALRALLRGASLRLQGDMLNDRSAKADRAARTFLHLARVVGQHPVTGRNFSINSRMPDAFTTAVDREMDLERPIRAALVKRIPCLADSGTDCVRLFTGQKDGVRGLVAEKYGKVVTLEIREPNQLDEHRINTAAELLHSLLNIDGVCGRAGDSESVEKYGGKVWSIIGDHPPDEIVVRERGVHFFVCPRDAGAPGLFLDQRDNRSRIRKIAGGGSMLNLFSYTCGFSVVAALGGASAVTSVDLSARNLDWGRRNFELNGLDPENFDFSRSDALSYVRRAGKLERKFDVVVIDAPTFSHGLKRRQSFAFARDVPELLRETARIVNEGGRILLSTNNRKITSADFRKLVREGLRYRKITNIEQPTLPVDFAMDRDHAKSLLVQLD